MHQSTDHLSVGIRADATDSGSDTSIPEVYELNFGSLFDKNQLWLLKPNSNLAQRLMAALVPLKPVEINTDQSTRNDIVIKSVYTPSSATEDFKATFEIIRSRKRMRGEYGLGFGDKMGFALSGTGSARLLIGTDPSYKNMSTLVEISTSDSFKQGIEWKRSNLVTLLNGQRYYLQVISNDTDVSNFSVAEFWDGDQTVSRLGSAVLHIVDESLPVTWEVVGIGENPVTPSDFLPSSTLRGTVNVARSYRFDVDFNNDTISEADKTFSVKITGSPQDNVKIGEAPFTIIDDDLSDIEQLVEFNGSAFFLARDGLGRGVWKTDGSAKNTIRVYLGDVLQLKVVGSYLVFVTRISAASGEKQQLWYAEATSVSSGGTISPKLISESLIFNLLESLGNSLFFTKDSELFFLETVSSQPKLIAQTGNISNSEAIVAGNYFYYLTDGDLYSTDGQDITLLMSKANTRGSYWSDPTYKVGGPNSGIDISHLTAAGNTLYFTASTPRSIREFFYRGDIIQTTEIWRTDGTRAGTHVAFNLRSDGKDANPGHLTASGDTLFFTADDGVHGRELFEFRTEERRHPLFILPGIGAVFPNHININDEWVHNRGFDPSRMAPDPFNHTYDDLIKTLENVGYTRDKDLFVVTYDWRLPPGPIDVNNGGVYDGWIDGITADSIGDSKYEYGVDYLGEALAKASREWERLYGENLGTVDIIGHSTGGLVARTYIQSDAYGSRMQNGTLLPQVKNLITFGTPQRGASKALNPINNNWGIDFFYKLAFREINEQAYRSVLSGQTINAPVEATWDTGPITKQRLLGSMGDFTGDYNNDGIENSQSDDLNKDGVVNELDAQIFFLYQFNPTNKALLSTYLSQQELPWNERPSSEGVDVPDARNNFLIDLNGSLDMLSPGKTFYESFGLKTAEDVNSWVESINKLTAIYGTNVLTPTGIIRHVGPISSNVKVMGNNSPDKFDSTIFSFGQNDWPTPFGRVPGSSEVWYEDVLSQNGDGTVPLDSLEGLFLKSPKDNIQLIPFTKGVNTDGSVEHSGLLSNRDALRTVLQSLDVKFNEADISTDLYTGIDTLGVLNSSTFNWLDLPNKILRFLSVSSHIGPFNVGFSYSLPGLAMVPAYSYPESMLWVSDEHDLNSPSGSGSPELYLTGKGTSYDISVSGRYLNHEFFLRDTGLLDIDQNKTIPLKLPTVCDDSVIVAQGISSSIPVLSNDYPFPGQSIEIYEYEGLSEKDGLVYYSDNGTVSLADDCLVYTPAPGYKGSDSFSYKTLSGNVISVGRVAVTVLNDDLPVITLAVSPSAGVTEDGISNLVYTFSRAGATTNPLTVNYTVAGSATLGVDYTGIAATLVTKTVSFAAGTATTTVTVTPSIDTLRESDESVMLTLAAGSGYTVGSTSTATGTIIDDDRDFLLSTVSGLSLLQDESTGLIRLKRANSSSVPVTWGNNTPLTAATFPGWQLLAAAQLDGADSLLWRYLPTGQLHTWTLDQNGRQTSGSPLYSLLSPELPLLEQKFGVDLDADGHLGSPNVIVSLTAESRAGTAYFPQSDSLLYREAATDRLFVQLLPRFTNEYHYPIGLLWGGTPILAVDSRLPGWSAVAASSIDGVNTLLWRNQSADLLATWSFDSLWNAVSGTAPVLASSDGGFALEKVFKIDMNNDGVVGAPFVVLATNGVTSLLRLTSDRRLAVQSSNGQVHPLLWGGSAITEADPRLPGWSAVSAGVVNGVNTVVWRNSSASLLATWSFDSQWRATGGTSPVPFSSPHVWDYETWSKKDLNNDHVIGAPPSGVVSTVGDLWLQRLGPNLNLYAFKPGSPSFSLRWGGSQLSTTDPRLSGWSPLAAATINGVNSLLWRYDATGQLSTWSFDANWNAISGILPVQAVSQAAHDLEVSFQADANRDGVIGSPHQVISSIGSIDLLASDDGLLLIGRDGMPPISMAWGGGALTVNDPRLTGWTAIAAANINGSNSLLWRHTTGQLATWTFDANWNALSGTAPVRSDSQAALAIEADFIRDLNGDGAIGEPTSPIERLRYRLQQVAPSSNSREPFSAVFSGGSSADVIVNPLTGNVQSNVLMSGSDFITGLPLQAGATDLLDGGTGPGRNTFLLSTITNQPFADDGDSGYVLIRNYDPLNDDLVVTSELPLTTSVRSVAFDGITVTGIGFHVDKNRNGFYDSGDNLFGLLDGITTVPSRLIRLAAG